MRLQSVDCERHYGADPDPIVKPVRSPFLNISTSEDGLFPGLARSARRTRSNIGAKTSLKFVTLKSVPRRSATFSATDGNSNINPLNIVGFVIIDSTSF